MNSLVCAECGKTYNSAKRLESHSITHISKEINFISREHTKWTTHNHEFCNRSNNHKKLDNNEMAYRSMPKSEMKGCDICNASFSCEKKLTAHKNLHTNQDKYLCLLCGKTFNQISPLKRHIVAHTGETPYKCSSCDKSFTTMYKLNMHSHKHMTNWPFKCQVCSLYFPEIHSWKIHMVNHTDITFHFCPHCSKSFTTRSSLQIHLRIHTESKLHKCDQCGEAFPQSSSLMNHKRTHNGEKPYTCHICGNSYTQKTALDIHLVQHTGNKDISCPCCNFKCCALRHLRKHVAKHHSDSKNRTEFKISSSKKLVNYKKKNGVVLKRTKSKICELCGKVFSFFCNMNLHMWLHMSEKRYACSTCGRKFRQISHLKMHIMGHTDTLHKCTKCDKSYTAKYLLKIHKRRHLTNWPYKCQVCGRFFSGVHRWKTHMATHTNLKLYNCTHCIKSFKKRQNLISHLRMHTGLKPYICDQCGRAFVHRSSLMYHKTTHSGVKPYSCHICGKSYTLKTALTAHLTRRACLKYISCPCCDFKCYGASYLHKHIAKCHSDSKVETDLILKDFKNKTSLVPENTMNFSTDHTNNGSTETNSTFSTENQPVKEDSFEICHMSTLEDTDQKINTAEKTPSLVPYTSHSTIQNYAPLLDMVNPSHEDQENSAIDTLQDNSSDVTIFRDDYINTNMIVQDSSDPSGQQCMIMPPSQEIHLHNSSNNFITDQPDIKITVYTIKVDSINQEMSTSYPNLVQTYAHILPYLDEQTVVIENQEADCSQSSTQFVSSHPQFCLTESQIEGVPQYSEHNIINIISIEEPQTVDKPGVWSQSENLTDKMENVEASPEDSILVEMKFSDHDPDEAQVDTAVGEMKVEFERPTWDVIQVEQNKDNSCLEEINDLSDSTDKKDSTKCKRKRKEQTKQHVECEICGQILASLNILSVHMKLHNGDQPYSCKICGRNLTCPEDLSNHMLTHYICNHCGAAFSSIDQLNSHTEEVHNGRNPFACSLCEFSSVYLRELKVHMKTHKIKVKFHCGICQVTFAKLIELERHMEIHEGQRIFRCHICGKQVRDRAYLKTHILHKHLDEKPFKCGVCDDKFMTAGILQKHMYTHTGAYPHICNICGKMFTGFASLKLHVRTHTKERPLKCQYCDQTFGFNSSLRVHERIHTGTKPYICDVCGKSFVQQSSLVYHKRSHFNLKLFQCQVCGNSYTRSRTLNIHMAKHTGQKYLSCRLCGIQFDNPKQMQKHMALTHASVPIKSREKSS